MITVDAGLLVVLALLAVGGVIKGALGWLDRREQRRDHELLCLVNGRHTEGCACRR